MPAAFSTITPAPVVEVLDGWGNRVADYTGPVGVRIYSAVGAQLLGTTTVDAVAGLATFADLQLTRGGHYTLTVSAGSAIDYSLAFESYQTVVVGPGTSLSFAPSSISIKAGDSVNWYWGSDGNNVVSGNGGTADNIFCSLANQACASAPTQAAGVTYRYRFVAPGSFAYFSSANPSSMIGGIAVE